MNYILEDIYSVEAI